MGFNKFGAIRAFVIGCGLIAQTSIFNEAVWAAGECRLVCNIKNLWSATCYGADPNPKDPKHPFYACECWTSETASITKIATVTHVTKPAIPVSQMGDPVQTCSWDSPERKAKYLSGIGSGADLNSNDIEITEGGPVTIKVNKPLEDKVSKMGLLKLMPDGKKLTKEVSTKDIPADELKTLTDYEADIKKTDGEALRKLASEKHSKNKDAIKNVDSKEKKMNFDGLDMSDTTGEKSAKKEQEERKKSQAAIDKAFDGETVKDKALLSKKIDLKGTTEELIKGNEKNGSLKDALAGAKTGKDKSKGMEGFDKEFAPELAELDKDEKSAKTAKKPSLSEIAAKKHNDVKNAISRSDKVDKDYDARFGVDEEEKARAKAENKAKATEITKKVFGEEKAKEAEVAKSEPSVSSGAPRGASRKPLVATEEARAVAQERLDTKVDSKAPGYKEQVTDIKADSQTPYSRDTASSASALSGAPTRTASSGSTEHSSSEGSVSVNYDALRKDVAQAQAKNDNGTIVPRSEQQPAGDHGTAPTRGFADTLKDSAGLAGKDASPSAEDTSDGETVAAAPKKSAAQKSNGSGNERGSNYGGNDACSASINIMLAREAERRLMRGAGQGPAPCQKGDSACQESVKQFYGSTSPASAAYSTQWQGAKSSNDKLKVLRQYIQSDDSFRNEIASKYGCTPEKEALDAIRASSLALTTASQAIVAGVTTAATANVQNSSQDEIQSGAVQKKALNSAGDAYIGTGATQTALGSAQAIAAAAAFVISQKQKNRAEELQAEQNNSRDNLAEERVTYDKNGNEIVEKTGNQYDASGLGRALATGESAATANTEGSKERAVAADEHLKTSKQALAVGMQLAGEAALNAGTGALRIVQGNQMKADAEKLVTATPPPVDPVAPTQGGFIAPSNFTMGGFVGGTSEDPTAAGGSGGGLGDSGPNSDGLNLPAPVGGGGGSAGGLKDIASAGAGPMVNAAGTGGGGGGSGGGLGGGGSGGGAPGKGDSGTGKGSTTLTSAPTKFEGTGGGGYGALGARGKGGSSGNLDFGDLLGKFMPGKDDGRNPSSIADRAKSAQQGNAGPGEVDDGSVLGKNSNLFLRISNTTSAAYKRGDLK